MRYVTTANVHLGDVVNMVQRHKKEPMVFSKNVVCPCCGNDLFKVLAFVLGLLDTKIRIEPSTEACEVIVPDWMTNTALRKKGLPEISIAVYEKARRLPEKKSHYVCSFSARTGRLVGRSYKKEISSEEMLRIVDDLDGDVYNLGDVVIPNTVDATHFGLADKFALIASARASLSCDNGIAHLGLMTDTEVCVFCPPAWNPRRFYPPGVRFNECSYRRILG